MEIEHNKVFGDFLEKAGQKYTKQRKNIVNEIFKIHEHFEIESFIELLHKKKIKVARATVYSTLKLLLESKLIRKVRTGRGLIVYEHTFGHEHHDHLICVDCDKVIEIHDAEIEKRQIEICEKLGFILENHTHTMYVRCKKFMETGSCEQREEIK